MILLIGIDRSIFYFYLQGRGLLYLTSLVLSSLLLYSIFHWNLYEFHIFEFADELTVICFNQLE